MYSLMREDMLLVLWGKVGSLKPEILFYLAELPFRPLIQVRPKFSLTREYGSLLHLNRWILEFREVQVNMEMDEVSKYKHRGSKRLDEARLLRFAL